MAHDEICAELQLIKYLQVQSALWQLSKQGTTIFIRP